MEAKKPQAETNSILGASRCKGMNMFQTFMSQFCEPEPYQLNYCNILIPYSPCEKFIPKILSSLIVYLVD